MTAIDSVENVDFGDLVTIERDGMILTGSVSQYSPSFRHVDGKRIPNVARLELYHFINLIDANMKLPPVIIRDQNGVMLPGGERFIHGVRGAGTSSILYL